MALALTRFSLIAVIVLFPLTAHSQEYLTPALPQWEQEIQRALDTRITLEFINSPLGRAVEYIARELHINVTLDKKALDDIGLSEDTPVSVEATSVTLRSILTQMTRELELTFVMRDEALMITTPEEAESKLRTKIYHVGALVTPTAAYLPAFSDRRLPAYYYDFDTLIDLITSTISPAAWDDVGGPGGVDVFHNGSVPLLVVSQTDLVHAEIHALLVQLHRLGGHPLPRIPELRYGTRQSNAVGKGSNFSSSNVFNPNNLPMTRRNGNVTYRQSNTSQRNTAFQRNTGFQRNAGLPSSQLLPRQYERPGETAIPRKSVQLGGSSPKPSGFF